VFEDKKGNPQIDLSVWGFFFAICQIKEAGQMPALPRNCIRNEIYLNVTELQNGDWEGVESRLSRKLDDLSDG